MASFSYYQSMKPIIQRFTALESILVEKGYVRPAAIDALVETYETRVGPRNGAQVVAKAWSDPTVREWLLDDGPGADVDGRESNSYWLQFVIAS